MDEKDLYAALGLSRGASDEEIRKAYRRLAREHHPDVNPNDPEAEERFKEISFAYDVVSDPEKRKLYDEFGVEGLAEGFDPEKARGYQRWSRGARRSPFSQTYAEEGDLGELFSQIFGAGRSPFGAAGQSFPQRGREVEGDVTVDFMDAVRGSEIRVRVDRPRPGQPPEQATLKVRIPEGAEQGMRIRLAGQGAPGLSGGPAGDLYLTVHVRPHRFFQREGSDLLLDLPVTLPELIRGASVRVPTPEGPVSMQIPAHSQNGARLRLRGKGVAHRVTSGRGDVIVRLVARLPDTEDPALDRAAEELDPLYTCDDLRKDLEQP
jgi:DnaJ-class molecular chaperone